MIDLDKHIDAYCDRAIESNDLVRHKAYLWISAAYHEGIINEIDTMERLFETAYTSQRDSEGKLIA